MSDDGDDWDELERKAAKCTYDGRVGVGVDAY